MIYNISWNDETANLKQGNIITRSALTASGKAKVYNLASDSVEERNFKSVKIATKESIKEIIDAFEKTADIKFLKIVEIKVSQDIFAMPIDVFMKAAKKLDK